MRPIYESTSIVLMFLGKTPSPLALICKCFKPKYGVGLSQASTAHAGAGQAEERLCHFIKQVSSPTVYTALQTAAFLSIQEN